MFISREPMRYKYFIIIVFLLLFFPLTLTKVDAITSIEDDVPIYKISILENTQRVIWELCNNKQLSYELVLAIYQIEGNNNIQIDTIKTDIEKLAYYRDYWADQGYPDEMVYELMLLTREKGIEGCITYMKDNNAINPDDYVQKVTEYKYYLEQSLDAQVKEIK